MVMCDCYPRTSEAEARGSGIQSQSQTHTEFKAILSYLRHCLKIRKGREEGRKDRWAMVAYNYNPRTQELRQED